MDEIEQGIVISMVKPDSRLKPVYEVCVGVSYDNLKKFSEIRRLMNNWYSSRFHFDNMEDFAELMATASASGLYIDAYSRKRGILYIHLNYDFNMDNITPELIDFISKEISRNMISDSVDYLGILGMP